MKIIYNDNQLYIFILNLKLLIKILILINNKRKKLYNYR